MTVLQNQAGVFKTLVQHPGWDLLKRLHPPEINAKVTDTQSKEAFLYEAIRAQVIAEIFSFPATVIEQARKEMDRLSQRQQDGQEATAPNDN